MKKLYLECNSGISGDMTVAALIDAGANTEVLDKVLSTIPLDGFKTVITRVLKNGVDVCDFNVILDKDNHDHDMDYLFGHEKGFSEHHHEHNDDAHSHHHEHHDEHQHDEHHEDSHHHHSHSHEHRNLLQITKIINDTQMSQRARDLAIKIFQIIAQAECKAHNKSIDEVHFHEVGAIDSIVDIIAIAVCFDNLGIEEVIVPRVCEGTGTIRCQHGVLPIPVPAVCNIAEEYKIPLSFIPDRGEFITPTGVAFIAAVMTSKKLPEEFTVSKIGMGAGKRTYDRPSILRAFIIETANTEKDSIYKLETNIDDSTGETLGFVMEELFSHGALDAHYVPCFMKKNRPAWLLYVICEKEKIPELENIIFLNTTTIGIRKIKLERSKLSRKLIDFKTEYGDVKLKRVILPDGTIRNYPEYDTVAKLAREKGIPLIEILNKLK